MRLETGSFKWTESLDIAIALDEAHPEVNPHHVNFVDLRDWILTLEIFDDDPQHSGAFRNCTV